MAGWEDKWTVTQVLNAYNGYFEKENKRVELAWETSRWMSWINWNLHVMKKHRLNDPKKLIRFEWDKKQPIDQKNWVEINKRFPDKLRDGSK